MKYRKFTNAFKQHIIEQLVGGQVRPAEICRKYNIAKQVLARWQKKYTAGEFDDEPLANSIAKERIRQLEAMVGRLTMDKDLLKKALKHAACHQEQSENLLASTELDLETSQGGAEC